MFHTGMLSGQERKFNFLGTKGPPDTVETDTPRVRLLPSLPCYTELTRRGNHLPLQSSEALAACTHGSDGLNRCQ